MVSKKSHTTHKSRCGNIPGYEPSNIPIRRTGPLRPTSQLYCTIAVSEVPTTTYCGRSEIACGRGEGGEGRNELSNGNRLKRAKQGEPARGETRQQIDCSLWSQYIIPFCIQRNLFLLHVTSVPISATTGRITARAGGKTFTCL